MVMKYAITMIHIRTSLLNSFETANLSVLIEGGVLGKQTYCILIKESILLIYEESVYRKMGSPVVLYNHGDHKLRPNHTPHYRLHAIYILYI